MTKQARSRVPWTCPDCGRDYQLSAGRTPPPLCKQCTRRNEKAARTAAKTAPSAPALSAPVPPVMEPLAATAPVPRERKELPADVESHIAGQERERLLADVANISRTMTFFRRLVWGMVIMMILNFVLIGAAFLYSMKQMSSLDGLPNQGGAAIPQQQGQGLPGNQQELPPGIADKMKPIQDYFDQLNEVLEETR